jgi:hypothetical protein
MDDTSKDYMLDTAMASKRLTPTQKIKYFTEFINNEHDRVMEEYDKCIKNNTDEHSTT